MRIAFASLMILAVALAGCSQGADVAPTTADLPPADGGEDGTEDNGTDVGPGPDDGQEAPTAPAPRGASLTADVTNGTAPLSLNVTIDALDPTNVTAWRLDWGDGNSTEGETAPATVDHTLGEGNFTLDLTVAYIDGAEAKAALEISVTSGAGDPIIDAYTASLTGSAPYLPVSGDMPSQADFVWASHENDAPWVHAHAVTVPAGATALAATTELLNGTAEHPVGLLCAEGEPVAPDSDLFLFQADGTFIASSGNCGTGESVAVADPAPGDYVVINWAFLGSSMDVPATVTISVA